MSSSFQPSAPSESSVVTIERVDQKTITRRDGSPGTLYQVFAVGAPAPFETFKRDLAESAHSLINRSAEARYTVNVNGQFTNYRLESILPAQANPVERAQRAQEAQPILREAAGLPHPSHALSEAQASLTDKDRSICRQTAGKVAATLFAANPSDAPTFWENVERLTAYFEVGIVPGKTTAEMLGSNYEDDIPF